MVSHISRKTSEMWGTRPAREDDPYWIEHERGDAGNLRAEKFSGSVEVEGQLERTGTRAGVAAID